jgi:carbamoyltransferase
MTVTCNVRPEWRDRIPAVVHVDGTARPQVIRREDNPTYYDILRRFEEISGLPCAINTSFNAHEEPIINRPEEALRALEQGRVDLLVTETGIFSNGPGAPAPTGHRIDASVDMRRGAGLPCGLGGRPR